MKIDDPIEQLIIAATEAGRFYGKIHKISIFNQGLKTEDIKSWLYLLFKEADNWAKKNIEGFKPKDDSDERSIKVLQAFWKAANKEQSWDIKTL